MNTQDLVPLLNEIQTHKKEIQALNQELEQARQAYEAIEQKTMNHSMEIRNLYSVIQYSIEHDMDPLQAKLTMSSDRHTPAGSYITTLPLTNSLTSLNTNLGAQLMANSTTAYQAPVIKQKSLLNKIFSPLKS